MTAIIKLFEESFPKHIGKFWYLVSPNETTFEFSHEVPDYHKQIWVPFFILLVVEQMILSKRNFRLNDQITSLSHWMLHETVRILSRSSEYYTYNVIYETFGRRWNLLAWDSTWTWYISFIAVDFCYYWAHRSNHEIAFLWAHHQVHHSSEEFNLAVGLRQSILQHWLNFVVYLPLAFFIPSSHYIVHYQLNLIYQLWIHTTLVDNLGLFELIINTPRHHRVHHGCNLYCLDKNYGGVLIIWDRLFGTFQEKKCKKHNNIIYGLVHRVKSFNSLYQQLFYLMHLIKRSIHDTYTWTDKLAVFWKGPSWSPGLPRLGLDALKKKVKHRTKYDPQIPNWQKIYVTVLFLTIFLNHFELYFKNLDAFWIKYTLLTNLTAFVSIGLLLKCTPIYYIGIIEFLRLFAIYLYLYLYLIEIDNLTYNFTLSVYQFQKYFWLLCILRYFILLIDTQLQIRFQLQISYDFSIYLPDNEH